MTYLFFSGSAAAALLCLWAYHLTILWEHPALAAGVTASATLAGMSLALAFLNLWPNARVTPRRALALTLATNSVWAALSLPLMKLTQNIPALHIQSFQSPAIPGFLVGLILLPLTFCMGLSLLLARQMRRQGAPCAGALGAATGLALAGYLLVHVGLRNCLIGLVVLLLFWALQLLRPTSQEGHHGEHGGTTTPPSSDPLLCRMLALSTWAIWAAGWQRLLEMGWGSSVTAVAVIFLVGVAALAGGAWLYSRYADRWALIPTMLALAAAGLLSSYDLRVPLPYWPLQTAVGIALCGACLGRILPARRPSLLDGPAYLVATLVALSVLLPRLGLDASFRIGSALAVLGACWAVSQSRFRGRGLIVAAGLLTLPALYLLPPRPLEFEEGGSGFRKDGAWASLRVRFQGPDNPGESLNGARESWSDVLAGTRLLGYLPSLHHALPRRAALLGRGGGILQALQRDLRLHSIQWVCPEAQVKEADAYFQGLGGASGQDPRVNFQALPLTSFLLNSAEPFDLILCDADTAGLRGLGHVWTEEFYRGCLNRLDAQGVFSQTINLDALPPRDLGRLLCGFFAVFPEGQLWQVSESRLALLGSPAPMVFHIEQLHRMWSQQGAVRQDLVALNILDPAQMQGYRLLKRDGLLPQVTRYGPCREDLPSILTGKQASPLARERNRTWMHNLRGKGAANMLNCVQAWINLGDLEAASVVLDKSPDTAPKAVLQCRIELAQGRTDGLSGAIKLYPQDYSLRYTAALEAMQRKAWPEAIEHLKVCVAQAKDGRPAEPASDQSGGKGAGTQMATATGWEYPALASLASCYEASGQWQLAAATFDKAAQVSSLSPPLRGLGRCLLHEEDLTRAQSALLSGIERNPNDYQAWNLLGQAYSLRGQWDEAVRSFQAALRLAPADSEARRNLAAAYAQMGLSAQSQAELKQLLRYSPAP